MTGADGNGALKICSSVKEVCAQAQAAETSATARKREKRIPIAYRLPVAAVYARKALP
jgi:hypothetical protein